MLPKSKNTSLISIVFAVPLICVLTLTIFATQVHARQNGQQVVSPLTLEDCISIAQQIQPSIQAQQSGVAAAVEQKNIAKSAYLPQVGFQAQYAHLDESRSVDINNVYTDEVVDVFSDAAAFFQISRQAGSATANFALDNPNTPLFPGGPSFNSSKQSAAMSIPRDIRVDVLGTNVLTTQTQLVQPLWTGGKIDSRNEQASLGVKAANLNVVKSQHQVAFNVTRAYLSVLLTMELERAVKDSVGQASAIEKLVGSLVEGGNEFVSNSDLYRVRTIRLLFDEQELGFQQGRERAQAALKLAMGWPQQNQVVVAASELPKSRRNIDWDEIREMALSRQPDLKRAQVGEQIARQEVRAARAEYRPDIALFGSLNTVLDDESFGNPNDSEEWSAGVTAQIPFYTGGRRRAQVRRATHLQTQLRQNLTQVEQAVAYEARDAFLEYQEMGKRLEITSQAVKAAEETSSMLAKLYQLGLEDEDLPDHFEDVLTGRLLLLTSQTRYNQALFAYNLSLARLKLVTVSHELPSTEATMSFSDETSAVKSTENEPDDDNPKKDETSAFSPGVQFRFSDRSGLPLHANEPRSVVGPKNGRSYQDPNVSQFDGWRR